MKREAFNISRHKFEFFVQIIYKSNFYCARRLTSLGAYFKFIITVDVPFIHTTLGV